MKNAFVEPVSQQVMDTDNHIIIDTDKAWENLFSRLEQDHLLSEDKRNKNIPLFAPWVKVAASLLMLVTTGFLLYLTLSRYAADERLTVISNPDNNTLVQVLYDGTVVYLAENASIHLPEMFSPDHRTVKFQGEGFFDVEHQAGKPFFIETEPVTIQVLGTSFNLRSREKNEFELFVEQGLVRISLNKQGRQILDVREGEMARFENNQLLKYPASGRDISSWRIKRLHFKDETLDNVLSVINRNYGSQLRIENQDLKNRRITVTFYNNSLPTIVELLCLSMNIDAEELSDATIVFKPKT